MTELEWILMLLGGVVGYALCFVVEIAKLTRFKEPPSPRPHREEKDPADWWKECK